MTHWLIELLSQRHVRDQFDCGVPSLNTFLKVHSGQNARKNISRTYVAIRRDSYLVDGYYTLANSSISFAELPPELARRLPRYPVPAVSLGRLAVDVSLQGLGLGRTLLFDACQRIGEMADKIGIHAVVVHALSDRAKAFYVSHGFMELRGDPRHLFLPVASIGKPESV